MECVCTFYWDVAGGGANGIVAAEGEALLRKKRGSPGVRERNPSGRRLAGGRSAAPVRDARPVDRAVSRAVAAAGPTGGAEAVHGKAYIIDGDTIDVGQARVRPFGMDAPELAQGGGFKARSQLIGLAGGRQVSVQPVDVDCYGRIVARVRCEGVDLSERMVHDGFARAMTQWHLDYAIAEWRARRGRRGLWADDAKGGIGDPAAFRRAQAIRSARRW